MLTNNVVVIDDVRYVIDNIDNFGAGFYNRVKCDLYDELIQTAIDEIKGLRKEVDELKQSVDVDG